MIYLASRSPRRAEILRELGVTFSTLVADVDESPLSHEPALHYVQRIAASKAEAGWQALLGQGGALLPVLAADTTVSLQGEILAKPEDDADARRMLRALSGQWHEVYTALALMTPHGLSQAVSTSRVLMRELSDAEIDAYVASGEPRDKAGAYGIQGQAGLFIARIEGSYSGVMGLPIHETGQLLREAGIDLLPLLRRKKI